MATSQHSHGSRPGNNRLGETGRWRDRIVGHQDSQALSPLHFHVQRKCALPQEEKTAVDCLFLHSNVSMLAAWPPYNILSHFSGTVEQVSRPLILVLFVLFFFDFFLAYFLSFFLSSPSIFSPLLH